MKVCRKITVIAGVLLLASCQQLPRYFSSDTTLARVGGKQLQLRDVKSVVPQGVVGDDSTAFMKLYIDRWTRKQLKLQEAEVLFSSSEADIDRMVEEYRQALLIRKLEQQYVDRSIDTTFTDEELAGYYADHKGDFKLDRAIVRGRIVRIPDGNRQEGKLKTLITARDESRMRDFRDICAKNNFVVTDLRDQWVDFSEFLSYLPASQSQNHDSLLNSDGVQVMSDNKSRYLFQIEAARREGEAIPLERLRPAIRRILFNQRQGEIIRNHEEELYKRAVESGEVKIYATEEPDLPPQETPSAEVKNGKTTKENNE